MRIDKTAFRQCRLMWLFFVGSILDVFAECVVRIKPEWELDHEGGASEDFSSPEHGAGGEVARGRARKDVLEPTHLQFAAPPILEVRCATPLFCFVARPWRT